MRHSQPPVHTLFLLSNSAAHLDLHSFPTRRSSDLFDEFGRAEERLTQTRERIRVGKLSGAVGTHANTLPDRKSTRLNSSHRCISYAVFCLKKKKKKKKLFTKTSKKQRKVCDTE